MHKLHVIETDLEPDDVIAMHGIWRNFPQCERVVVWLGESRDPECKVPQAFEVLMDLQDRYPFHARFVEVHVGAPSQKGFPYAFPKNIFLKSCLKALDETSTVAEYEALYAQNPEISFMLKPPREAVCVALSKTPPYTNTEVYCYGSFNWRTLKISADALRELTARYKRFNYVDSFSCVGSENSAHISVAKAPATISKAVSAWNQHILEDCIKDLEKEQDAEAQARLQKIINNISVNLETQFVLADVCVTWLPRPERAVKLVDFSTYPKWEDDPNSNVFVHTDSDDDRRDRRSRLLDELSSFL